LKTNSNQPESAQETSYFPPLSSPRANICMTYIAG